MIGRALIVSDGSATLYFLDPVTKNVAQTPGLADHSRQVTSAVNVTAWQRVSASGAVQMRPVARLNELEYIKGRIFANVW